MSGKQDRQDEEEKERMRDAGDQVTEATSRISDGTEEPTDNAQRDTVQLSEQEQAATGRTSRKASRARMRRAEREAARRAQEQAEYERHPSQWKDTAWQMEAQLLEATLALPADGYRAWLSRHQMYGPVGVQPSAYENPISEYLHAVMGLQPQLQTDGHRAWFLLQLTKAMRNTDARYLRVVLPTWVTPLALEYTGFPVGRTSGRPQPKDVSAYEAYRLLQRILADPEADANTGPETDPDVTP